MSELNKQNPRIPMRLIGLTALFSCCLAVSASFLKKDSIELNLMQDARKALSAADLPFVGINFQGREAILTGSVTNMAVIDEIVATIGSVFGVRKVSNQLSAEAAIAGEAPEPIEPEFENGLYIPPRFHPLEKYNLSSVQFVYAKSELTEDSLPVLDRLATLLKQNQQIHIELSVHTDNQGTALGQITSTQLRADTLREYFIEQGVQPEQLVTTGYGATRPVAHNDTDEGRQKNRRVDITVLKDF
ncbi:MAG: OmpA family protein [Thiolinea sp.]